MPRLLPLALLPGRLGLLVGVLHLDVLLLQPGVLGLEVLQLHGHLPALFLPLPELRLQSVNQDL